MLAQNLKKIFDELDEKAIQILSVIASSEEKLTAYDVWKRSRIPQRTVYKKLRSLSELKYVNAEVEEKLFKRTDKRKTYYDITLKGALAALSDEKICLEGHLLEKIATLLHIPREYAETVRPIISIWAYHESKVPRFLRLPIDEDSIFYVLLNTLVIYEFEHLGLLSASVVRKELELESTKPQFMKKLRIKSQDEFALKRFIAERLLPYMQQKWELMGKTYNYIGFMPLIPYLSDFIEIIPDVAIKIIWAPSPQQITGDKNCYLFWLRTYSAICELVSKGEREKLRQFLSDFLHKLFIRWMPICFRQHLDGICSVNNVKCPFSSPLECDIVQEHAKNFKKYLDRLIYIHKLPASN